VPEAVKTAVTAIAGPPPGWKPGANERQTSSHEISGLVTGVTTVSRGALFTDARENALYNPAIPRKFT